MRKKALTKDERKIHIINWFTIRLQHDNDEWASMYQIAKGIGMSPSSHLANILYWMVNEGDLEDTLLNRAGRFKNSRGYRLKRGTFQRPTKQTVKVNFTVKGIRQMELL
jgi:hypothetical protein